jgi:hypothetical protein
LPVLVQINAAGTNEPPRRHALAYPKDLIGLPEPWPALRANEIDAPDQMFVTGITTDEFDGHRVAVLAIRSRSGGFVVEAEVTLADNGRSILEDQELIWWARDDRGQSYLGTWPDQDDSRCLGEGPYVAPAAA